MDPLSATGSIISVLQLSVKILAYLNDVKDALKERAKCASEISNLYALLFNLRVRLEEGNFEHPWYIATRALTVENGPIDQFKDALELLQTRMTMPGDQLKKASKSLVWKFQKGEIASILGRMERLKTLVQIALEHDHFKLSKAINDNINTLQKHVTSIQSGVDNIWKDQDLAKHRMLMECISPTDYSAQQSDIINRRQKGTGQWFLDAPEVVRWLNTPKETLFCPGIPGAGKTMIAAIVIDYLVKSVQNTSVGIAYVYCNYKAQEQNTSIFLAAIIKQLVLSRPSTADLVEELRKQYLGKGTKPSFEELLGTLKIVLASYTTVYVVVDALDECRDTHGTHQRFPAELQGLQAEQDLRFMVTSRFTHDIVDGFKGALRLEVKASNEDVRRFVAGQVYRLPNCVQSDSTLQEMVQSKITEAADGMFLLARLHTDSLLDKRTKKQVKIALDKLAKGSTALDDAYKDAVQRIEGQLPTDSALAKRTLSWITCARRPLKTSEILCALAVERGEPELDYENILAIEDIVLVCAGLVTVDEESDIIRLAHYTTQEYFERTQQEFNPGAQREMASTCLTYLSFNAFRGGACPTDQDFESRLEQNVFLDYAAKHWGHHAVTVQDKVYELACSVLLDSSLLISAVQAMSVSDWQIVGYCQRFPKQTTGLHVTASFGLSRISERLFPRFVNEFGVSVNTIDSTGQTPLLSAVRAGHIGMAKILLDNGADIHIRGGEHGNVLQVASSRGDNQMVMMLLNAGAHVNMKGANGDALQAASAGGHQEIVEMLLNKGANVNMECGHYGNALQAASAGGHKQIVEMLLDQGANVNMEGGHYGNALFVASARGHSQIVEMLLDKGANMNMGGIRYGNALQAASVGGYQEVVEMLLNQGANVNMEGGYYGNALQAASVGGHKKIVEMLLDKGANVNMEGGHYSSALQAASERGHQEIVEMLLRKGAKINVESGFYGNALQAASVRGHQEIVEMLLNQGANVNMEGGLYNNALQAASARGHKKIVEMLLDQGANVNMEGGFYGNALQAASTGRYKQTVEVLLNKGAQGQHTS